MAKHHHHDHGGADRKTAARERLTTSGEQWTGMREAVFDALAGFDRPASAYDIAEAVSKAQERRVAAQLDDACRDGGVLQRRLRLRGQPCHDRRRGVGRRDQPERSPSVSC